MTLASSFMGAAADFPKIASLRDGEIISVTMRLYGYTITGADFVFTPEKVTVEPLNKKSGELVLTAEEKARVDEYLKLVRPGERRRPSDEGFEYSIKLFRNGRQIGTWSFPILEARQSANPKLSLYELKNRVEKAQKHEAGKGQPAAKPAEKPALIDQHSTPAPSR